MSGVLCDMLTNRRRVVSSDREVVVWCCASECD